MTGRVFLAGATGVIGARLLVLLRQHGYEVFGMTRAPEKAGILKAAGATPAVVDVFDARALREAMTTARPEIVIHQLTDLPPGLDPAQMADAIPRNARIRSEGTQNLVAAATAAGARRFIAQSIAWGYATGPEPHGEDDPLDLNSEGSRRISIDGIAILERLALGSPPLEGIVLRYGRFYGPGAGTEKPAQDIALHIDAAAFAAFLAIEKGQGIYNIAEPNMHVSTDRARQELGWTSGFRLAR